MEGPRGGKDAACEEVAGGGPFGRRALLGLGEKDGEGRAPPQAVPRLYEIARTLRKMEEAKGKGKERLTG